MQRATDLLLQRIVEEWEKGLMVDPTKEFFIQTSLFMQKLLRHLVIQILILGFVLVDVRIHKLFVEQSANPDKASAYSQPPPSKKCENRRQRKGNKRRKHTQGRSKAKVS